jgi:hypothetical protein
VCCARSKVPFPAGALTRAATRPAPQYIMYMTQSIYGTKHEDLHALCHVSIVSCTSLSLLPSFVAVSLCISLAFWLPSTIESHPLGVLHFLASASSRIAFTLCHTPHPSRSATRSDSSSSSPT